MMNGLGSINSTMMLVKTVNINNGESSSTNCYQLTSLGKRSVVFNRTKNVKLSDIYLMR